ncbi:MAG: hypothetical protein IKY81_00680 [Methanocorpusculum sp.]|nr:hypothetical protein [Methanocorpusculum sp.]
MNTLRRITLTAGALLAGFILGLFTDSFLASKTPVADWAKALNADYANLLTFGATALLVLVTVIYAGYTYRQVTYSKKQFLLDKQPCVIPAVISRNFSDYRESETEYTRTLRIEYKIANVGTETAFSVQPVITISYPDEKGTMHRLDAPGTIPAAFAYIAPGEEKTGSISLYEKGTEEKSEGLELLYPSFGYRLTESGDILPESDRSTQKRFPVLMIKVYCRNLVGQWFSSVIYEDITAVIRTAEKKTDTFPHAAVRYRLETSQTIQHLPLEIQEVDADEVRQVFARQGKNTKFPQTEDV